MAGRREVAGISEAISAGVEAWVAVRTEGESLGSSRAVAEVCRAVVRVGEERRRSEEVTQSFFVAMSRS